MSRMNDAMIDFCELSVANVAGDMRKEVEFELTMKRLIDMDRGEQAAFYQFLKAMRIVERIKAAAGERRLRWATKLWNAIDCIPADLRPDTLWALMLRELPDCYCDNAGPNGLKFTY